MEGKSMTYVIQEPCVGVKDTACVEVCPVDCIYETVPKEATSMLPMFIHNEECIDCGACEPECPVDAIRVDDEAEEKWTQINLSLSEEHDINGGVG
jgi:ferredoxin